MCPPLVCEFRPMENSPPSPVFFKVKKTHEVSTPSQNGELAHQKSERKQHSHSQPSPQIHQSQPVQPQSQQSQSQSTSSDGGGSESEGGSLPPSFPDEDPERMRHSKITAYLLQWTTYSLYMLALYVFDRSLLCDFLLSQDGSRKRLRNSLESSLLYLEHLD